MGFVSEISPPLPHLSLSLIYNVSTNLLLGFRFYKSTSGFPFLQIYFWVSVSTNLLLGFRLYKSTWVSFSAIRLKIVARIFLVAASSAAGVQQSCEEGRSIPRALDWALGWALGWASAWGATTTFVLLGALKTCLEAAGGGKTCWGTRPGPGGGGGAEAIILEDAGAVCAVFMVGIAASTASICPDAVTATAAPETDSDPLDLWGVAADDDEEDDMVVRGFGASPDDSIADVSLAANGKAWGWAGATEATEAFWACAAPPSLTTPPGPDMVLRFRSMYGKMCGRCAGSRSAPGMWTVYL
jgi:hypothetical protein